MALPGNASVNLRQLEVFNAVMRSGSVTGAARQLGVTQPAVSKLLRHAEDQLGLRLFERMNGRLYPTVEAQAVHAEVERVYDDLASIRQRLVDLRKTRVGSLRLASIPALAFDFLPRAIAAFKASRPEVRVEMRITVAAQVVELVNSQQIDLGLSHFPGESPMSRHAVLGETPIVCAMRPDHPLAARSHLTPEDLADQPVICTSRDIALRALVDEVFRAAGVEKRQLVDVNQSVAACALARYGMGVALVEQLTAGAGTFDSLVVRPFLPRTAITVGYMLPRYRPMSQLAQAFIGSLQDAFHQAPSPPRRPHRGTRRPAP
jgi:DNA-binding transcriptional LysR family regulator